MLRLLVPVPQQHLATTTFDVTPGCIELLDTKRPELTACQLHHEVKIRHLGQLLRSSTETSNTTVC